MCRISSNKRGHKNNKLHGQERTEKVKLFYSDVRRIGAASIFTDCELHPREFLRELPLSGSVPCLQAGAEIIH
jgi:hypothetical protein